MTTPGSVGAEHDLGIDGDAFVVLLNSQGQYSLWPAGKQTPAGWSVALQRATRVQCLAFVEAQWTDMRPNSLVEAKVSAAIDQG